MPASNPTSSNNCLFQGVVCACVPLRASIHACILAINLYLINSWAKLVQSISNITCTQSTPELSWFQSISNTTCTQSTPELSWFQSLSNITWEPQAGLVSCATPTTLPHLLPTVAHWPSFVIHCAGLVYCCKNSNNNNNKTCLNQDRTSSWSQNMWSLTSFICMDRLPLQRWCFLFYASRLPLPP